MNRNAQIVLLVSAVVLAIALVCATLVQAAFAVWGMVELSKLSTTVSDTLELLADQYIDAGFSDPGLREDDPLLKDRRIYLGYDVNARTAKDVVARLFHLNSLDPEQPIDLYISTQGGWPDNAFAIIDAMQLIDAPVNTWAVGGCYSAGALILTAGTGRRYATDDAIIMVHANMEDSSTDFSFERLSLARYESVFRANATLPEAWYPMTEDKSYYLSPEEALEYRMIDEVVSTMPERAAREDAAPVEGGSTP